MKFEKTPIDGLLVITPNVYCDERGYFFESFHKPLAMENGMSVEFVQDNESKSKYGTLRGMHFQKGKWAQAKLVRVTKGAIIDVAVDLRVQSPTFGKHFSVELNDVNKKQFFIPRGFAHGFIALSEEAILQYKCDNFHCKEAEGGLNFSDPELSINWVLPKEHLIINDRDFNFPKLAELDLKAI